MLLRILKLVVFVVCTTLLAGPAIATTGLSIDELRLPDHAIASIQADEKSAYQRVVDAYAQALREHPADASLALAQCNFIEHFSSSEDLAWADAATKDFDACLTTLDKRFSSDADVALYVLERRYGQAAIDYGNPLVVRSADWRPAQRARLHAVLSRSYGFLKNDAKAGQEAVLAAQLDPGNERLITAIRYLAKTGRTEQAGKLLAAAPVAKNLWQENGRINVAIDVLPGSAAKDELRRAQQAGLKMDAYMVARVFQHDGDSAGAEAILTADAATRKFESAQTQQLRLDVAFDTGNAKVAADIIHDQYVKNGNASPFFSAYAHLVKLDPGILRRPDLLPMAIGFVVYMAIWAACPGLLLFPAHYRGTVRSRAGTPATPMFERIGLRDAWWALAIFFVVLFVVMASRSGTAILTPGGSGVARAHWQSRVLVSYLWAALFCALALAWVARHLSWRDWTGGGTWKARWFIAPALLLVSNFLQAMAFHHAGSHSFTPISEGDEWALTLVNGAVSLGGVPLALAVVSVLVPIMEELVFRGCVLGGLSRHMSFRWANVWQALLFVAVHRNPQHVFFLFVLGAILGFLANRTRGLAVPIAVHAINNAIYVFAVV